MFVTQLSLADFRSWEFAELSLAPGVTTLTVIPMAMDAPGRIKLVEKFRNLV